MATPTPKPKPPRLPPKPKPTAKDGHRGSLTRHNVKDTTSEGKTMVPEKCDICRKFDIEANCTTCAKYICEHCVLIHKQMTELKDHKLVMLALTLDAVIPSSAEAISMDDIKCVCAQCDTPGGCPVSACCLTCGDVGCPWIIINHPENCAAAGHITKNIDKDALSLLKTLCVRNIQLLIDPTEKLKVFESKVQEHDNAIKPTLDREITRIRHVQKSVIDVINSEVDLYINKCTENAQAIHDKVDMRLQDVKDNIKQNDVAIRELTNASNCTDTAAALSILVTQYQQKYQALGSLEQTGSLLAEDIGTKIRQQDKDREPRRTVRTLELYCKDLCDILEPTTVSDDSIEGIDNHKPNVNCKTKIMAKLADHTDITRLEGRARTIFASSVFDGKLLLIRTLEKEIIVADLKGNVIKINNIAFSYEQFWINPRPLVLTKYMCGVMTETSVILYTCNLEKISEFQVPKGFKIRAVSSVHKTQMVSFESNCELNFHQFVFTDYDGKGNVKRARCQKVKGNFPLDGEIFLQTSSDSIYCAHYAGKTIYQYSLDGTLEKTFSLNNIIALSVNNAGELFIVRGSELCLVRKPRAINSPKYELVLLVENLWIPDFGLPCALYSNTEAVFYLYKECNYACPDWLVIQKYKLGSAQD